MDNSSQYIVSARKYRPDSFEDLIGQDNIVKTLKNSIIRGKLAHAYLFCGPRGVGKTSAARIFAKTINCEHPSADMEPCGECESCISFKEGRSYCIHELDAASNNGVDDIRALTDQVQIPPQVGKYSVYIIDEVHMLSPAAFNAFLKTLEEPPAHAIFILATTEKHKVLPTILSRCQTYDFNRIGIPDIVFNLRGIADKEGISIDDESLHIIARKADGAMRDALTIFDQTVAFCGTEVKYEDVIRNLNVLDYEHSFNMTEYMLANDYASALLEFDGILSKGFNALYFVSSLSTHFRNLMIAKNGALDALLELPESLKKKYKEQADKCSLQFLYEALAVTSQCESGYKESINPRLHIEFALMKLCFLTGGPVSIRPGAQGPAQGAAQAKPQQPQGRPQSGVQQQAQPLQPQQPQQPSRPNMGSAQTSSQNAAQPSSQAGVQVVSGANAGADDGAKATANVVANVGLNAAGNGAISGSGTSAANADAVAISTGSADANGVATATATGNATATQPVNGVESATAATEGVAGAAAGTPTATSTPTESVAASAAGVTDSTATPVARRKRSSRSASSLSLDSITDEDAKTSAGNANNLSDRIPEDDEVFEAWKKIPANYASRPRLYTTLSTTKIAVKPMEGYKLLEFYVMNLAQKTWVEQELLKEIEAKIQQELGSSQVRLAVAVIAEEKVEKKIYMPADKAKVMISENAEVEKFVKDLDLDVK